MTALCAFLAGADNWEDITDFGQARQAWFATFWELPNGIPSHATFKWVFTQLDSQEFQASFLRWMQADSRLSRGQGLAIDGKILQRSDERGLGKLRLTWTVPGLARIAW